LDVQAAERVTGQHVRPGNMGTFEQRVQVRGNLGPSCALFAASLQLRPARSLHTDSGLAGHGRGAEKALPAATARQAHAGGLEERVRNFIATSQASRAFRSTYRPIG